MPKKEVELKVFPHEGVSTQLLASKANPGQVGVFALVPIPVGTNPFSMERGALTWVSEKALRKLKLSKSIYKMYDRFGALEGDRRYAPRSFDGVKMSWYIADNETRPNLWYSARQNRFYTLRCIKVGEELTVDYSTIG